MLACFVWHLSSSRCEAAFINYYIKCACASSTRMMYRIFFVCTALYIPPPLRSLFAKNKGSKRRKPLYSPLRFEPLLSVVRLCVSVSLQIVDQRRTFGIRRAFSLEKVRFNQVRIGILRHPLHAFRLVLVLFVQIAKAQAVPAQVAQILNVAVSYTHLTLPTIRLV